MNLELFRLRLEQLVEECGGRLAAPPITTMREARIERLIVADSIPTGDAFKAKRDVQPFRIDVIIEVERLDAWHHESGDDRRLHPDLKGAGR